MTRAIISLTTIPPRLGLIEPTLRSLLAQTAKIERIVLYVPRRYRREGFADYRLPQLPRGIDVAVIDTDYGPATKVLPAVKEYQGEDVCLLYCDDDRAYDRHWAERLIAASRRNPRDAIVQRGAVVSCVDERARYLDRRGIFRLKRNLSLGLWKPCREPLTGTVDIAKGCSGVLVKPAFFPDDAFDIPDILWTVDDIWLSGMMAVNRVSLRLDDDPRRRSRSRAVPTSADAEEALSDTVYQGHDRWRANKACVDYLRRRYGVWPEAASPRTAA